MDEHLAILGHDLRAQLGTIKGLSELITLSTTDPQVVTYAQHILHHNQFMLDLVNGLVLSAKAGGVTPTLAPLAPWQLVDDIARGLAVGPDLPPIAVVAHGQLRETIVSDRLLLRQILTNVLGNAVRFTREGGVRVLLEQVDDRFRCSVIDTGPGMDAQQLAKLFRPDATIQRATDDPRGHGLGLWIAHRLTELLGGSIRVRSHPGQGTAMIIEVPCGPATGIALRSEAELRQAASAGPASAPEERAQFAGQRILVVDDTPANRLLAATLLKRLGAAVTLAIDGADGVRIALAAQAGQRPFDLVIIDYHMPGLNGADTAAALRAQGHVGPLLCWTAAIGTTLDNLPPGFTAHLEKPTIIPAFYATIHECLAAGRPSA